MKKEEFLRQISMAEAYAGAASDLLMETSAVHMGLTANSVLQGNKKTDAKESAFWWVQDQYGAVSAAVHAAYLLSDVASNLLDKLYCEAEELIPEEATE